MAEQAAVCQVSSYVALSASPVILSRVSLSLSSYPLSASMTGAKGVRIRAVLACALLLVLVRKDFHSGIRVRQANQDSTSGEIRIEEARRLGGGESFPE